MNLENEVATNIQKIMKLLLLFSIISFTYASAASKTQANSSKPKETIRMAMFIVYYPIVGRPLVTKAITLIFEDVKGLPISANSSAFGDVLRKLRLYGFLMVWKGLQ